MTIKGLEETLNAGLRGGQMTIDEKSFKMLIAQGGGPDKVILKNMEQLVIFFGKHQPVFEEQDGCTLPFSHVWIYKSLKIERN